MDTHHLSFAPDTFGLVTEWGSPEIRGNVTTVLLETRLDLAFCPKILEMWHWHFNVICHSMNVYGVVGILKGGGNILTLHPVIELLCTFWTLGNRGKKTEFLTCLMHLWSHTLVPSYPYARLVTSNPCTFRVDGDTLTPTYLCSHALASMHPDAILPL